MSTTQPDLIRLSAIRELDESGLNRHVVSADVMSCFEEHHDRLLGYVLTFGLTRQDAEEVVQEVFLALFHHLILGRPRDNMRAWLFAVAHNLALKQRMISQRWDCQPEADILERQSDPAPSPEENAVSAQRQQRLLAVVQALSEQDRWCLYLRSEGLRYREIAKTVGISLGSVSLSLSRSFARLLRSSEL